MLERTRRESNLELFPRFQDARQHNARKYCNGVVQTQRTRHSSELLAYKRFGGATQPDACS